MYNDNIIMFFKRHNLYDEEMFKYLEEHTDFFDYYDDNYIGCLGSGEHIDSRTGKLTHFRICIPYCINKETMLVDLHEIMHGIVFYKHLNKKYKEDITIELLPFIIERMYLEECKDENLIKFHNRLDSTIDSNSEEKYRFALRYRDELYKDFNGDIESIEEKVSSLVKKWCKK